MKISSAVGLGLTLAILGAAGYAGYIVFTRRGAADRQPQQPGPYNPPQAQLGQNQAPPSPQAPPKSAQQEAHEWIGVAGDVIGVAEDLGDVIRGWAN